jgi:regulator of replication initiation timing
MESLMNFLMFALPGGFIGSVFTWFFGRRKRNNDMLSNLQASINMLSDENRKILDENIQLRRENAELKANQEEMLIKLSRLTKEVECLRKVINKQTGKKTENDEKVNPGGHPHTNYGRIHSDGVCYGEAVHDPAVAHADESGRKRNRRRSERTRVTADGSNDFGGVAAADDSSANTGGDSGIGSEGGCPASEPP